MRTIDRLANYLAISKVTRHAFEKACGVANGYIAKQLKGKGSIGSDIVQRIITQYPDLNLEWLIMGKGEMLRSN